jgi:glycosyltransferase involved in cell wall biosynthesis
MKISILIPVYNEFRTLPRVLDRVRRAPLPPGCEREIIVVDDGSTDGTAALLAAAAAPVGTGGAGGAIVAHAAPRNRGKGAALRAGLALATGAVIVVQDGDLEYDPADYPALVAPILAGRADVVYGSRFLAGPPAGMARANRLANRILTAAANCFYAAGLTDEATAYKAFRAPVLRRLDLRANRFGFCPEVTAKLRRLGYAIHEVPIRYFPRGIAEGKKIRPRDGFAALAILLACRLLPRRACLAPQPPAAGDARRSPAPVSRRAPAIAAGPGRTS